MKVYKHYSSGELNDQYNVRLRVPNYAEYLDHWVLQSKLTAAGNHCVKDTPYGDHPEERLDIFPSAIPFSKTLVFIHGGYWYMHDKAMFHFLAGEFLQHNITTVLINYPLAPRVSITDIVASCRKALRWQTDNIFQYNGDPGELYLLGHSAGGHLASMMLTEEEAKSVRAMISLSGLFRLEPIMLSYHNDSIGMDYENVVKNSPVLLEPIIDCPLLLVTGADETDEFKAQSEELYQCWESRCTNITCLELPQKNHYSILDSVVEKDSVLQSAILRLMNVNPATDSLR